jgi:hypothetical protein
MKCSVGGGLSLALVLGFTGPVVGDEAAGERLPKTAGKRHRIRFVNITRDDILTTSLSTAEAPVTWEPVAKDGARVPLEQRSP